MLNSTRVMKNPSELGTQPPFFFKKKLFAAMAIDPGFFPPLSGSNDEKGNIHVLVSNSRMTCYQDIFLTVFCSVRNIAPVDGSRQCRIRSSKLSRTQWAYIKVQRPVPLLLTVFSWRSSSAATVWAGRDRAIFPATKFDRAFKRTWDLEPITIPLLTFALHFCFPLFYSLFSFSLPFCSFLFCFRLSTARPFHLGVMRAFPICFCYISIISQKEGIGRALQNSWSVRTGKREAIGGVW